MKTPARSFRRGFTLTEVIISVSIGSVIAGMATWFMIEGARSSLKTTNTSLNDLSQWSIFTAISVDSKIANGMTVYENFTAADMSDISKRITTSYVNPTTGLLDPRGNVLILTRSHQDESSKKSVYDQVTGYIYSPTQKTLKKFVYEVTAAEKGDAATSVAPATLEEILVNNLATFSVRKITDQLTAPDLHGVFLVRQDGHSGILTVEVVQGDGNNRITSKKLIDASFFIRG